MTGTIRSERPADGVVEIVIDRPPLNVLDVRLQHELAAALRPLHEDHTLRAVLVRGEGTTFSVGADVKELAGTVAPDPWSGSDLSEHWTTLLESLPCLTISCIQGHCLGGGLEVALCTDVRLAAADARLGFPEVRLGLVPGMGGTVRLPRLVGVAWATRLVMTGESLSAERACGIGLVNEVVPDPRAAGLALAASLGAGGPLAQRVAKSLVVAATAPSPTSEVGLRAEWDGWHRLWGTADQREGLAAFLAHRPARFVGR